MNVELEHLRMRWLERVLEEGKPANTGVRCCPASAADPHGFCPVDHPRESSASLMRRLGIDGLCDVEEVSVERAADEFRQTFGSDKTTQS